MNDAEQTLRNDVDCRHYATLLCALRIAARRLASQRLALSRRLNETARQIYHQADPSAWPAMDTIKRVLEIDREVDNPATVLLRASVDLFATPALPMGSGHEHTTSTE
jgi:hypothetical protein